MVVEISLKWDAAVLVDLILSAVHGCRTLEAIFVLVLVILWILWKAKIDKFDPPTW